MWPVFMLHPILQVILDTDFVMTLLDVDDKDEGLNSTLHLDIDDATPSFGELCFSIIPLILKNNKSGWLNDNHLILNTGSTATIFKNKNLLSNIYSVPFDKQLTVFCNSGTQKNYTVVLVPESVMCGTINLHWPTLYHFLY